MTKPVATPARKATAQVIHLRPVTKPQPAAVPPVTDPRHTHFTNTNGRRWGR